MSETIHIALSFNDPKGTYARHAAVTMVSIFENTSSPICVHVLHDDTLTLRNRAAFEELAAEYGQQLLFHDITALFVENRALLERMERLSKWSKGALFRLFLPEVCTDEKVIYLDCDIIASLDIAELWKSDLGQKTVGVVPDGQSLYSLSGASLTWRQKKIWSMWNIRDYEYFNSGVMLFDLGKLRREYDIFGALATFLELNARFVMAPDQDYLNWLFAEDKTILGEKFNRKRTENITYDNCTGYLWHMMWKPWSGYEHPALDDMYWKYLRKTPYCTTDEELLRTVLKDLAGSYYMHRHTISCLKRILKQLSENIFRVHIICLPFLLYCLLFHPDRSYRSCVRTS